MDILSVSSECLERVLKVVQGLCLYFPCRFSRLQCCGVVRSHDDSFHVQLHTEMDGQVKEGRSEGRTDGRKDGGQKKEVGRSAHTQEFFFKTATFQCESVFL